MSLPDRPLLALAVAALTLVAAASSGPQPDPRWQRPIQDAAAAIVRGDPDAGAKVEALRDQGRGQRGPLLVQLALFLERSTGTEQSMPGALIFKDMAFTPREKLDAILPGLDHAGPGLGRVFGEMLSTIDRPQGGEPDFGPYEQELRARGGPHPGLILYMHETSPGAALDSMERVYGAHVPGQDALPRTVATVRGFLSREGSGARGMSPDDLAKARSALDEIARDPAWWRRVYAAAIVRAHPVLSTPDLASRLERDPDPVVRRALRHD